MMRAHNDITIPKLNIAISDRQQPHGQPPPPLLPSSSSAMPIYGGEIRHLHTDKENEN